MLTFMAWGVFDSGGDVDHLCVGLGDGLCEVIDVQAS